MLASTENHRPIVNPAQTAGQNTQRYTLTPMSRAPRWPYPPPPSLPEAPDHHPCPRHHRLGHPRLARRGRHRNRNSRRLPRTRTQRVQSRTGLRPRPSPTLIRHPTLRFATPRPPSTTIKHSSSRIPTASAPDTLPMPFTRRSGKANRFIPRYHTNHPPELLIIRPPIFLVSNLCLS